MKLRWTIVLILVTAFVLSGVTISIPADGSSPSQAWAGGGSSGGQHNDDDDDDDRDNRGRRKGQFDHFACYTVSEHVVNKDVKIVNQFTRDEAGTRVAVPVTVGELALLCVPTKKIHIEEEQSQKPLKPRAR